MNRGSLEIPARPGQPTTPGFLLDFTSKN